MHATMASFLYTTKISFHFTSSAIKHVKINVNLCGGSPNPPFVNDAAYAALATSTSFATDMLTHKTMSVWMWSENLEDDS